MASNIVHRETWVHRVKLVREHCAHLLGDEGWRWRVLRPSNAYSFNDPKCSESKFQAGTANSPTAKEAFGKGQGRKWRQRVGGPRAAV
jgi:hypothetical protein